jgi:methylthioribose-1-phosphate isomerase
VRVAGVAYRSIWPDPDAAGVHIVDQTRLPHEFVLRRLEHLEDAAEAIRSMRVRGAPLIGVAAAYGLCLALRQDPGDAALEAARRTLLATRPTAVNLRWALDAMAEALAGVEPGQRFARAWQRAGALADADVATCRAIGEQGLPLLETALERRDRGPLQILTHCNAGWLAAVDWGTALAPIYLAHQRGLPLHVWVDETRPRNQGASLTAWELGQEGIAHTVVADNVGGHLMQTGRVDLVITGSDRTTFRGDVCNKIGTYLKALAARESGVPFYVALPGSTLDWSVADGLEIPIEERSGDELRRVRGRADDGRLVEVAILPDASPAANFAFDVTPARLVSALVTERGVCEASEAGLTRLYPEHRDPRTWERSTSSPHRSATSRT